MEKTELSPQQLLVKAQSYCAPAERCESQVIAKLMQWGAGADEIEPIMDQLRAQRFVDNARYAAAVVHDKVAYQSWGRQKMVALLRSQGISGEDIQNAMQTIDESEYNDRLARLIASRKGDKPDRLYRFLLQRGFTYSEINAYIKN